MNSEFTQLVETELTRARQKHTTPINSAHEGYAVMLEEMDEFWDEVRKQERTRSWAAMLAELVQIAAMAQRCAEDLGFAERKTP